MIGILSKYPRIPAINMPTNENVTIAGAYVDIALTKALTTLNIAFTMPLTIAPKSKPPPLLIVLTIAGFTSSVSIYISEAYIYFNK